MATVDLLINGVSYWADTVFESCHFESQVNGVAGACSFRVRDPDRTKTFVPGQTILLTVDGNAVWRGFVSMVNRVFVFPALNVSDFGLARFIDIVGIDINILLSKRIVYNQATPTTVQGSLVAAHTPDSTAIATLFASWIDLSGDGLDTTTLVENVADTTWTQEGTLWEGSDTWGQAMQSIANLPAAIYYIDPDKNFVYTDVDTPNAPFGLSDTPQGAGDNFDRIVANGQTWGTGALGAWVNTGNYLVTLSVDGVYGVVVSTGDGNSVQAVPLALPNQNLWSVSARIQWPNPLVGGPWAEIDFWDGVSYGNGDIYLYVDYYLSYGGATYLSIIESGGPSTEIYLPSVPASGEWATYAMEWDYTAQVARAKYWLDSETEPDWQVAITGVTTNRAAFAGPPVSEIWIGVVTTGGGGNTRRIDNVLSHGVLSVGYREMEILKDGTGLANDVMAWGIGYGLQTPIFDRETDAISQTEHGLWQLSQTSFGVYKQGTINRIAQSIIDGSPQNKRGAKDDKVSVQCVTYEPGLRVAQKVDFTSTMFGFNDVIPVRKMEIDFPAADTPKYTLTLSHEIDTPFGFFDPFLLHLPSPKCPSPLVMGPNGKCILPPIIHGCDCGITDSFIGRTDGPATTTPGNRIIGSFWGLADVGVVWNLDVIPVINGANDGTSNAYIDAGIATIETLPTGTGVSGETGYGSLNLLIVQYFDALMKIRITGTPPDSDAAPLVTFKIGASGLVFNSISSSGWGTGTSPNIAIDGFTSGGYEFGAYVVEPSDGNWWWYHWERTAAGVSLRRWLDGDTEPIAPTISHTWVGTPTPMTYGDVNITVTPGSGSSGVYGPLKFDIAYLDIAGVNRCTAVQFDDFSRTVVSGWGTATPSGYTWTDVSHPTGSWGVGTPWGVGARGYGVIADGQEILQRITGVSTDPWGGAFTMTSVLGYDTKPTTTKRLRYLFAIRDSGGASVATLTLSLSTTGDNSLTLSSVGSYTIPDAPPPNGTAIYVKWEYNPGGILRAKVWWGATDEPDWQLSDTDAPSTQATKFEVKMLPNSFAAAVEMYIDSIDFDYAEKPCHFDGPLPPSVSSNAWVCEGFDVVTTTLTLAHSFLVNSPRVWLNGLLQPQSSYTQNGIAGTITFDFTPTSDDNARVCYWATA